MKGSWQVNEQRCQGGKCYPVSTVGLCFGASPGAQVSSQDPLRLAREAGGMGLCALPLVHWDPQR